MCTVYICLKDSYNYSHITDMEIESQSFQWCGVRKSQTSESMLLILIITPTGTIFFICVNFELHIASISSKLFFISFNFLTSMSNISPWLYLYAYEVPLNIWIFAWNKINFLAQTRYVYENYFVYWQALQKSPYSKKPLLLQLID